MALTTSYLITTKNLEPFFNGIISARAPERFTQKFLESLEFKSTNDRLYIGLLKGLGFIDEGGCRLSATMILWIKHVLKVFYQKPSWKLMKIYSMSMWRLTG